MRRLLTEPFVWIVILGVIWPMRVSSAQVDPIVADFESYRSAAVAVVRQHLIHHPNCLLRGHDEVIRTAQFNFGKLGKGDLAWAFPDRASIIFASDHSWRADEAATIMIHESLHLSRICGKDATKRRSRAPACILWSLAPMLGPRDITDEVLNHVTELKQLRQDN